MPAYSQLTMQLKLVTVRLLSVYTILNKQLNLARIMVISLAKLISSKQIYQDARLINQMKLVTLILPPLLLNALRLLQVWDGP